MSTAIKNARFAYNNYLDATTLSATAAKAGYPLSNAVSGIRSKLYKAENRFEIHSKNCQVHIDATTYKIAEGTYSEAQLITAFNAAVDDPLAPVPVVIPATLSKVANGFKITSTSGSKTFKLGNQTDSVWSTLGFLTTADKIGTSIEADEMRHNNGAWIKVDLGMPQNLDFAALLPPANEAFSCSAASIKMQGNNIDYWLDDFPVNLDFEVSDQGAFFAGDPSQPCRYWRIFIDDPTNDAIEIAVAWMGSAVICSNTNIATGFTRSREDTSVKLVSENGTFYIDRRPKVLTLSSISVQLLRAEELLEMEQLFYDLGIEKPFFLCIDPKKQVSSNLAQMTHYVAATNALQLQHVLRDYYNLSIELREVL